MKDACQKLLKEIKVTTKSRFNSSNRMIAHSVMSNIMIVISSTFLITLSLMKPFGFVQTVDDKYLNLLSVLTAIVVLIYSNTLAFLNYPLRSYRFYQSASELNRLARGLKVILKSKASDELIEDRMNCTMEEYHQLLMTSENNSEVDYLFAKSHLWMNKKAIAAWLIPSEFMQTNYGQTVRYYLSSVVSILRIHSFPVQDLQFENAKVRSVLVIYKNIKPLADHEFVYSEGKSIEKPERLKKVLVTSLVLLCHIASSQCGEI